MFPKVHLTLHSKMSGSRWVITPLWLSGTLRSFLYRWMYSCHLFLVSSATVAADAAVKSLQSCPTQCDPIDGSLPGSPIPGILQARTLEWVAISFSNAWKWKAKSESEVAHSCLTLSNPMAVHTISVLYCAHLCMKCSLGISNFLFFFSNYFFKFFKI